MKPFVRIAVLVAIGVGWYMMLPPRTRRLPTPIGMGMPVRGAMHVHTLRSDGTGTVDAIAAAAARAGLAFVIFTDHGDGTRKPDPPASLHGVLCIDAVEISTDGGHVVALGLAQAPYPLAGEPRDVLEDIARLGGFAIAAHPGSAKPQLRWTDWRAAVGGLEWLNGDSEWRDEGALSLARVLFTYPARQPESLALLLDRPDAVLAQWDALTQDRRVVAVAAADAHARIGLRTLGEPYDDNGVSLHVPSYEQVFRTFSIALPGVRLVGDAASDAAAVLDAIRQGHVYSAVDALATPALVTFTATSGEARAAAGDSLPLGGPVTLRVDTGGPADAVVAIYKNGAAFRIGDGSPIEEQMPAEAAVYRVEVRLPGAPGQSAVPWMLSNPIYVGRPPADRPAVATHAAASAFAGRYENGPLPDATIERSEQAAGRLSVVPTVGGGTQLAFRYAIGGRASESPYAALALPAGAISGYDRLMFTARADRPMRLSVQVRAPGGQGQRWQRSMFIDQMPRVMTVYFDEMAPRGPGTEGRPALSTVDSLLFVVDAVNTRIGSSGQVWLDAIKYAR